MHWLVPQLLLQGTQRASPDLNKLPDQKEKRKE